MAARGFVWIGGNADNDNAILKFTADGRFVMQIGKIAPSGGSNDPTLLGKPVGRDVALGRPSAAIELGLGGALAHFKHLIEAAGASVPDCRGAAQLRALVAAESERLVPVAMAEALTRRASAESVTVS